MPNDAQSLDTPDVRDPPPQGPQGLGPDPREREAGKPDAPDTPDVRDPPPSGPPG